MQRVLIGITGFGAATSDNTGIDRLLREARRSNPEMSICRFYWTEYRSVASYLNHLRDQQGALTINVAAHSYGAQTAADLFDEIHRTGGHVKRAFIVDPVYRPRHYLPSFRSLFGWGEIVIARSVSNLWAWRQGSGIVRGCDIKVASNNHTKVWVNGWVENTTHQAIDSLPEFHETVLREIQR